MNNRGAAWAPLPKVLLGAAAGMLVALLFTGCTVTVLPPTPQTAKQLARGALGSWSKAGGFRFQGDSTGGQAGAPMHFTATESPDGGQATATGTLGGQPFKYLAVPGKDAAPGTHYLQGLSFWKEYYKETDSDDGRASGFGDGYVATATTRSWPFSGV